MIQRVPLALPVRRFLQTPIANDTGRASGTPFDVLIKRSQSTSEFSKRRGNETDSFPLRFSARRAAELQTALTSIDSIRRSSSSEKRFRMVDIALPMTIVPITPRSSGG